MEQSSRAYAMDHHQLNGLISDLGRVWNESDCVLGLPFNESLCKLHSTDQEIVAVK